jgi:ribosomal RNA assembly protein
MRWGLVFRMSTPEQVIYLNVPVERIAVLVGTDGQTKRLIEETFGVTVKVDSSSGQVELRPRQGGGDPTVLLKARDTIVAIGNGFSPEKALQLSRDEVVLEVIDVSDHVGKDPEDLKRVMGRIIGAQGKTRRIIEETAHVDLAITRDKVSIIGHPEDVDAAKRAVMMLIEGAMHSTVYRFLDQYAQRRKFSRRGLF